jgi:hypothetical protein
LRIYRDEQGRELFDLPDAPRPSTETPAPVRFLPEYDNLILGFAERQRVLPDEVRALIWTGNGMYPTFLVDGFVRGRWKVERKKAATTLVIEPFGTLPKQIRNELLEEGERLMRWILDDAEEFEIQIR